MTNQETASLSVLEFRMRARFYISLPMAVSLRKLHQLRLVEEMANK